MKPIMLLGVVLIVIGVLALAYQGITYTTREKVIDLGPLHDSGHGQSAKAASPGAYTS